LEKKWLKEAPEIYVFISNMENPISLEMVDENYIKYLVEKGFRKTVGIFKRIFQLGFKWWFSFVTRVTSPVLLSTAMFMTAN